MNKAKALVILSPGFPENEADSTCLPLQQILVKTLKEMNPGLNVIVLAFQYPFESARYQFHGVDVMAFGGKSKSGIFRLVNWLRIWFSLRKLNKQYQLTGLLSFWLGECAFIGEKFAKRNNLKHFCWILGQDAKPCNKYVKWTNPTANSLIALSDSLSAEFLKNYRMSPQHLIPPGIDTTLYKSSTAIERYIDILGVGSLIPLKQYDLFINIINLLRKYSPDIKAVICGQGPEEERLKAMIKVLDLEKNIELTGELPHSSVLELMQRSKVFLHTSAYEGFVVVCLEALYAGAQVVSMVRPMVSPIENWHIIQNQGDIAHKIKEILEDTALNYQPVLPYTIQDTGKAMIQLFYQSDSAIT